MARAVHFIQAGSGQAKIGFVTTDAYSDIGPVLGISKLGNADTVDAVSRVGDLFLTGQALRMVVRYRVGTEMKTSRIICDVDKAPSARAGLIGKTFNGGQITSASFPRRRRLG
jgi:hypothetical protein